MNSGKMLFGMIFALIALSSFGFAVNYTLTVTTDAPANGTVTGSGSYASGSLVAITATPAPGLEFIYWNPYPYYETCTLTNSTAASTTIRVNGNCTVKANFWSLPHVLNVIASPANGGSVSGSASGLANGSVRAISATPNSGWSFSQWTKAGACSIWNASARNTSVTVNGDCQITATFAAAPQPTTYSLNVYPSPLNSGYVTGSTAGLAYGSVRSISAAPYSGYRFDYWVGNCPIANQYAKNTSVNITPSNGTVCNTYAYTTYTGINQTNTTNKPDLTIPSLKLNRTVYVNKRAHGSVETKNIGNGTAGNSTTSYYINGALVNSVAVPQLAPGASSTGAITFICTRVGTYTLSAKADSTGILNESREDNNAKNLTFNCVRPLKAGLSQPAGQVTQKTQTFASITDSAGKIWSGLSYLLGFGQR